MFFLNIAISRAACESGLLVRMRSYDETSQAGVQREFGALQMKTGTCFYKKACDGRCVSQFQHQLIYKICRALKYYSFCGNPDYCRSSIRIVAIFTNARFLKDACT